MWSVWGVWGECGVWGVKCEVSGVWSGVNVEWGVECVECCGAMVSPLCGRCVKCGVL